MPTIHLDLAFSPVLLVSIVCIGFASAFWFYRFTVPVVSPRLRLLLALLRGATLAGILFLLAQPLLRLTTGSIERPLLAVLIDESESMGIDDRGVRRSDRARMALQDPAFAPIFTRSDVRHFAFATSLRPITDAVDTAGRRSGGTDFSAALRELARERERTKFDAVLFLTDGIATAGRNPIHDAGVGVPLYAIALGDTTEPRDLSIVRINANRVVYAGLPTPVDILLRSSGLQGGADRGCSL